MKWKDKELTSKVKELAGKRVELERMTEEIDDLKDQLNNIKNNAKTFTIVSVLEDRLKMVEYVEKNKVDS